MTTMNYDQLDFVTFCIGNLALRLSKPENEVYSKLKDTGVLNYIIKGYDVLHTFSKDYLMDDLVSYMKEKRAIL